MNFPTFRMMKLLRLRWVWNLLSNLLWNML
jgi:hypothetical protein